MSTVPSSTEAIVIYKSKNGYPTLEVTVREQSIWLPQSAIANLFDVNVPAVSKHISNIYHEKELKKSATFSKMEIVQSEGNRTIRRRVDCYNLDMIISVGYRVNSKRATEFRVWATTVLRNHLLKGYTLNQQRLQSQRSELREALALVQGMMKKKELESDEAKGLLEVITDYTQSWLLFAEYDAGTVPEPIMRKGKYVLTYDDVLVAIRELQNTQTSSLFGRERSGMLQGIVGNLYQTFDRKELYPTIEEKAAHLLYFVIKDHPFIDGNKRIGSLLFLVYLRRNDSLRKKNGERKFNDAALVALALLIAESKPEQKDSILRLIMHFVSR